MSREDAYRLIAACASSADEALALLRAEPSLLHARTGLGETPLHYLAVEDHVGGVRLLHENGAPLDVRSDLDETPLSEALMLGNSDVVAYLLDHGADPLAPLGGGASVLHAAARGAEPHFLERLLGAGVGVDARNDLDETPLHVAVGAESLERVRVLVDAGADVNARRIFDETPLHAAAALGATQIAVLLLERGADPRATDAQGTTPAESAARHGFADLSDRLARAAG